MKIQLKLTVLIATTILLCSGLFFTPASAFNTTKTFLNTQTHTLAPASIIVRSPNGGEQINAGDNVVIRWNYKGNFKYVEIFLLRNNAVMGAIKSRVLASKKQFIWRAGYLEYGGGTKLHSVGSSYKVSIVSENGKHSDRSDRNFTIKPEPSIEILLPKRGDVLHEGEEAIIRWKSKNLSGMATIDLIYTGTGGTGSAVITRSVPVTQGYFVWKKAGQTLRGRAGANKGKLIRIRCNQTIGMSDKFEIRNVLPVTGPKIAKTTHPFIIGGNPKKGVLLKEHRVKKMTQLSMLPDLKVVELKVTPYWNTRNFCLKWTLKVKNIGRADIVNTRVLIGNYISIDANWDINNPDDHLLNLKANEVWETTYTATIPYGLEAQGYKLRRVQFRWNIDGPKKVKELNETNNIGYYNVDGFPRIDDQNKNRRVEGKTKIIRY